MANFYNPSLRDNAYRRQTTQSQRNAGYIPTAENKTASQQLRGMYGDRLQNFYRPNERSGVADVVALPDSSMFTPGMSMSARTTSKSSGGNGTGGGADPNAAYKAQLNELYNKVMNYGRFEYDLNGDLLYRQMADQYTQLGKTAMQDATAQAAAMTGGYGNSYAAQVGNQAYQQYLTALNEQIPSLYEQAYNVWAGEYDRLLQAYQLAAQHPQYLAAMTPSAGGGSSTESANGYTEDQLAALLAMLETDTMTGSDNAEEPDVSTATPSASDEAAALLAYQTAQSRYPSLGYTYEDYLRYLQGGG